MYLQALMDSNLPRLQLELYKEIKKVGKMSVHTYTHTLTFSPCCVKGKMLIFISTRLSHLVKTNVVY